MKNWPAKINSFRQRLPKSRVYISLHYFLVTVVNSFYINKLSNEAPTLFPSTKSELIDLIKAGSLGPAILCIVLLLILTIFIPIRSESFGESVVNDLKEVTREKFSEQIKDAKTPSEVTEIIEKAKKL